MKAFEEDLEMKEKEEELFRAESSKNFEALKKRHVEEMKVKCE